MSREDFRRAAQRAQNTQSAVNIMWFSVLITSLSSIIVAMFCTTTEEYLIWFCAIIEGFAEPFYITNLLDLNMSVRVKAEGLAMFLRCLTIYLTASFNLWAFVYGQIVYSFSIFSIYCVSNASKITWWDRKFEVEQTVKSAAAYFFGIAVLKFFLSEGEKLVMMVFNTSDVVKGEFALVSNLGSIICRFLLLPIEEITYAVFSKDISYRDTIAKTVIKVAWILATLLVVYGYQFSDVLVTLVYGNLWSETDVGSGLSLYCIYLALLALNGVIEAIAMAMSGDRDLGHRHFLMAGFTVFYMSISYMTVQYGTAGLILANCCNALIRILVNGYQIIGYLKITVSDILPEKYDLCMSMIIFAVLTYAKMIVSTILIILIGGILGVVHLVQMYMNNRVTLSKFLELREKSKVS